jgi:predicted dehydrogenase
MRGIGALEGAVARRLPAPELGVGVVGTGMVGTIHARSARSAGARLIGVSASDPRSTAAAAERLGFEQAFPEWEALVDDPRVDVIHVCTPNDTHAAIANAAIERGKHVICEKPLAIAEGSADELVAAAGRAGIVAAVPFVYYPMVREARARAHGGEIGQINLIHGVYLQDWLLTTGDTNWRVNEATGGPSRAFADIGSHWCDLVEFVSGERIEAVSAQFRAVLPYRQADDARPAFSRADAQSTVDLVEVKTEDLAVVVFRTQTDVVGSVVVSQVSPGRKNQLRFELAGASGSLTFDQEAPEILRLGRREAISVIQRDPAELSPAAAPYASLPPGHLQGYKDCFDSFVVETYAVIGGAEAPVGWPDFAAGARAVSVTDAVIESARSGGWVRVDDLRPAANKQAGGPVEGAG